MIKYKCWTCGNDMEASESKTDQREVCPKCKTPNLAPTSLEAESGTSQELCYFCGQQKPELELSSVVRVEQYLHKTQLRCSKCGSDWDQSTQKRTSEEQVALKPRCPSCGSEKVVSTQLPTIPMGQHCTSFSFSGFVKSDKKSGDVFWPHLTGYVWVPRCGKCKKTHEVIKKTTWGLVIMVSFLAPIVIIPLTSSGEPITSNNNPSLYDFLVIGLGILIPSFLIFGLPLLFFIRFILKRILGSQVVSEKTAKSYKAVQTLIEIGWTDIYMALDVEKACIRSELSSQKDSSMNHT